MPPDQEVLPGSASPQLAELPESFRAALKPEIPSTLQEDAPAAPKAAAPAAKPAPATAAPETPEVEVPAGIAARLAAKKAPAAPAEPAAPAAPAAPEKQQTVSEIEALEVQMRAANKNWKPSDGWNKLKERAQRAETLEAELQEARKKIATASAAPAVDQAEIERLKAEHKQFSDELALSRLESHPDFKRQFVAPRDAELTRAKELLEAHGVDTKELNRIIALPRAELGKAVQALVEKIPTFDQTEVADAIRKAHTLEQGGRQALTKSKEVLQSLQQRSAERAREAFEQKWLPVSAQINEHLVQMEVPATATPEQRARAEQYNAAVQSLRAKAEKHAFSPIDEGGVAELSMKAAAYDLHVGVVQPQLLSEMEQILAVVKAQDAELKALRSRNPNLRIAAGAPSARTDATNDPAKMDHGDAAAHFFSRSSQ